MEESLNLCVVKLLLAFLKQDEYIWTEIQWEEQAGALSDLSTINYFQMRCKVFCINLVISHTLTQDVLYKQSGIVFSAAMKAFWVLFWRFPWL